MCAARHAPAVFARSAVASLFHSPCHAPAPSPPPGAEAAEALCTLPGIGPKVAACVCLFSLDKHEAIPGVARSKQLLVLLLSCAAMVWHARHGRCRHARCRDGRCCPERSNPRPCPLLLRSGHPRVADCLQVLHAPPAQQEPDKEGVHGARYCVQLGQFGLPALRFSWRRPAAFGMPPSHPLPCSCSLPALPVPTPPLLASAADPWRGAGRLCGAIWPLCR